MSYARLSEGDVYIWAGMIPPVWHCQICTIDGHGIFFDLSELKEHVQCHIDAGHVVPERAMARIDAEIDQFGGDATVLDVFDAPTIAELLNQESYDEV